MPPVSRFLIQIFIFFFINALDKPATSDVSSFSTMKQATHGTMGTPPNTSALAATSDSTEITDEPVVHQKKTGFQTCFFIIDGAVNEANRPVDDIVWSFNINKARDMCRMRNATLPILLSGEEHEFLATFKIPPPATVYIALGTKQTTNGQHVWDDGTPFPQYSYDWWNKIPNATYQYTVLQKSIGGRVFQDLPGPGGVISSAVAVVCQRREDPVCDSTIPTTHNKETIPTTGDPSTQLNGRKTTDVVKPVTAVQGVQGTESPSTSTQLTGRKTTDVAKPVTAVQSVQGTESPSTSSQPNMKPQVSVIVYCAALVMFTVF